MGNRICPGHDCPTDPQPATLASRNVAEPGQRTAQLAFIRGVVDKVAEALPTSECVRRMLTREPWLHVSKTVRQNLRTVAGARTRELEDPPTAAWALKTYADLVKRLPEDMCNFESDDEGDAAEGGDAPPQVTSGTPPTAVPREARDPVPPHAAEHLYLKLLYG